MANVDRIAVSQTLDNLLEGHVGVLYNQARAAVLRGRELVYTGGVNCNRDAKFDLASVSKILTGTLILRLAGQDKVDLRASAVEYMDELGPRARKRLASVTVARLLAHSGGLPGWYPFYTDGGAFEDILERLFSEQPPVAGMLYSDIGFMILGRVVELSVKKTFAGQLEELNTILGACFCCNPKNVASCVPTEYGNQIEMRMCDERGLCFDRWRDTHVLIRGQANDGNAFYYWGGCAGHAGVFASAADVIKLAALYLNEGAAGACQVIPAGLIRRSYEEQGAGRRLMWDLSAVFHGGVGHTGFTGTALWVCPKKRAAATLLTSRLSLSGPPELTKLRQEFFTTVYNAL